MDIHWLEIQSGEQNTFKSWHQYITDIMVSAPSGNVGMNVDEAFQELGTGRFNNIMYLILCLNFMYVPMHIFGDMFNTRIPPHHCKGFRSEDTDSSEYHPHSGEVLDEDVIHGSYVVPEMSEQPDNFGFFDPERTCHLTFLDSEEGNKSVSCQFGHWFDTSYTGETVVSEWSLVCENNSEIIFITIHGIAAVLGAVIFAPFSDKYGRKALLLMCWSQMSLMSMGMHFVGDMSSYLVLRFLQRLYVEGAEQAIFILSCEMLPTPLRANAVSGLYVFYGFGYLVLSLKAYLSPNWRYLQLAVAVGSFILLPINFLLPESPYWLVFMGREKSAEKFFRDAARHNKIKLPADFKLKREVVEDDGDNNHHHSAEGSHSNNIHANENAHEISGMKLKDPGNESRHTLHPHVGHFKELFQVLGNKMLRKEAGIASFTWAVSAFLYYGITVSGFNPGGDSYLSFFLSGVAVIVSSSSTTFILQRFGRKKPITAFCVLCAISMILKSTIPYKINGVKLKTLHKILKFFAKLFAAAIVSSTQLIVAELFPTTVRSTCVGLVSFFGLLGAGVGMYFSILERVSLKGSTIAAGVLTLLAGYLCRGLPETSNRPLPGTIVDLMDSYASVMEAIVMMMNKMPGGADVIPKADSRADSRANSIKFPTNSSTKRSKSSASSANFEDTTIDKRRTSIPSNIYRQSKKNKSDRKISFNTKNCEQEKNLNNACDEPKWKCNVNNGYTNEEDIVTKF